MLDYRIIIRFRAMVMDASQRKPLSGREILAKVVSYLSKQAVKENWLIGKGVVLKPSLKAELISENDTITIRIKGANTSADFICTRVITSKYRPEISFVHDTEAAPIIRKLVPLQNARRLLLDAVKPNSSIASAAFYEATALAEGGTQVNARRRWGELRTEYGFDTTYDGSRFVRGAEVPIAEPNPRPNQSSLNNDNWDIVYAASKGQCAKCGREIQNNKDDEGVPGLLDHRRPVPAGGSDDVSNLQLFCTVCNNLKNTACQRCPFKYQCERCTWAFPEKFHDTVVIAFTPAEVSLLESVATTEGKSPRELAKDIVLQRLQAKPPK